MIDNRGRFYITREALESMHNVIQRIMSKVIVVRCEFFYDRNAFEYTAISKLFKKVKPGFITPEYQIIFNQKKNGFIKWKFEEI